jgi:hypothetical protein
MALPSNDVELLLGAMRDAKHHSGVATMRIAANTAIKLGQFHIPALFERLMKMSETSQDHDRDVLCVALVCTFTAGQVHGGAYYGSYCMLFLRKQV